MTHGVDFFQMACEAVSQLGRATLMVTQDASVLPESLPSNVQHLPFAPFRWLFDRSAAVVHHGGIGTVGRALSAGVPQLVVPSGFDQFDNAERVIRLGIGRSLERIRLSASTLLETLSGMLDDPSVQERCAEVRERIAESDPLGETCSAIEALFDSVAEKDWAGSQENFSPSRTPNHFWSPSNR